MKRTFQKILVMLTVLTMVFSSVPFAFAEDNESAENEVLSTELAVEAEDIDADTDTDADADADVEENTPADGDEGTTDADADTNTDNKEPENGDDDQPAAPLAPAVPETPMDGDPEHVHTAGDWVIEKASFDKDGSMKKLCECGEVVEEETIPMVSDVRFDADPAAYIYEGEPITPAVTVKDSQGTALTQDADYTIAFSNNNKVGKATAKVTLQGEKYSGTKDFKFAILSEKLKRTNLFVGESKNAAIDASVTEVLGDDISFSIDDPSIATVDASGKVTGVAAGKTVLNAVIGGFTFKSDVTVIKKLEPTLIETSAEYDEEFEEYEYDWSCSHYFTSDGTESFIVEVYKSWTDYDDSCASEVILWDESTDDIIKEVDLKKGKGTVRFDSSYFKKGKEYGITVWCDDEYYDSDLDLDETYVDAAIFAAPAPEAFAFDETSYEMYVSDKQALAFTSDGGSTGKITWSTSDPAVATVSKGTVTAKGPGECTITATLPNGATDQCTIKVKKYENLAFEKTSRTVYGTTPVKLTLVNQSAISDKITWKCSNTGLATVDSNGKLTPKKAGTVTVTASVAATGKKATCKVTIKAKLKSKKVSIYMKKTYTNKLFAAPAKVYWSTSNKKVATVSSTGKITGQKPGTCTITAKCKGVKYTCKVTVKKIKLSKTSVRLGRNKKITLKVTGGSGTIKWKTSKSKVATVSSKGVVKGVNPGTCYISATRNGSTVKCKITVYRVRPNFGAYVYDYDTRNNRFIVKFKNKGAKTLYITSGIDVEQFNYRTFDRYISLSKTVAIAPGKSKLVYFKVKGSITYWDYETFNLYYHFKYDGKKYTGVTWNEGSEYKVGKKWPATYKDEDWYYEWDAY